MHFALSKLVLFIIFCGAVSIAKDSQRPNIIIILVDDMGFNDVSFHGSNQILTPNIDALAYNGIILNRHYTPSLCTPSRASLLTGKYPINTGTQHFVILNDEPWGLPLQERLLPELLRSAGYATHLVGKWHVGGHRKEYTPLYRGFDEHFGYLHGYIDYYDHSTSLLFGRNYSRGLDLRRQLEAITEARGLYATHLFTAEAVRVIRQHDKRQPLFLLFSHLAPHTGNETNPLQAPEDEVQQQDHIADLDRRIYAAMVNSIDESVAATVQALQDSDMLDNSIILFLSDNGAPSTGMFSNTGSNAPLRGIKDTPFEGGSRTVAAFWSSSLQQRSYISQQPLHVSDWLPTLAAAAGVTLPTGLHLDGKNMWRTLSRNSPPQQRNILHELDDVEGVSSYMRGALKYINGSHARNNVISWEGEINELEEDPRAVYYETEVLQSIVHQVLGDASFDEERIGALREAARVRCPPSHLDYTEDETYSCEPQQAPCLFNILDDPCERYNLAQLMPEVVQSMEKDVLTFQRNGRSSARVPIADARADPALHNGLWTWWLSELDELKTV